MRVRVIVLAAVCAVIPRAAFAQAVEVLYSPAVLSQALSFRAALPGALVHLSSAASLVGASAERKEAFGKAGVSAVVIVGDAALKGAADVPFSVPVILVNASGPIAATQQVIRVFDTATAPPGATAVVGSRVDLSGAGREISLKGEVHAVVRAVIASLK